ncbi:hypothetical protein MSG28_009113 [Choristoneura fumiferana]|uniref:Uncharacterized protein n=1 Tax=Choristoneura fumiferana TaxID=7141 RepID=A0ACC0KW32_CHOFU|nr:hypothetical protein MSG28_009113 [Choristoneura fumiferana]
MEIKSGGITYPFRPLLSCAPVAVVGWDRGAHSQDITKNIQYISNEKVKLTTDPVTLKFFILQLVFTPGFVSPGGGGCPQVHDVNDTYSSLCVHGFSVAGYLWGEMFHTNPCRAPALFLLSKSDPVGAERSNRAVHDSWREMGTKCTWKCWDKSPHVQHYSHHPQEYLAALYQHLDKNCDDVNKFKKKKK